MPKLSQKGVVAQLLMLVLLAAGLGVGLFLVKTGNLKIFSHASNAPIVFKNIDGSALSTNSEGLSQTTSPTVWIELTSTLRPPVPVSPPPSITPAGKTKSFYRLNDPKGSHFYTSDLNEVESLVKKSGFTNEGSLGLVYQDGPPNTLPIYRVFNDKSKDHLYTLNQNERDSAIKNNGYKFEGVVGFIYKSKLEGTQPIYRLRDPQNHHFYTIDANEKQTLTKSQGFADEGILGYILSEATNVTTGSGGNDIAKRGGINVTTGSGGDNTTKIGGPDSPPPGCYWQQVQCIKAPCNPILVCSKPTPPPPTSSPISYKIAENPTDLDKATLNPYLNEPTILKYTFKDQTPGIKFIWVEFKDTTGKTDRQSAKISFTNSPTPVPPSGTIQVHLNSIQNSSTPNGSADLVITPDLLGSSAQFNIQANLKGMTPNRKYVIEICPFGNQGRSIGDCFGYGNGAIFTIDQNGYGSGKSNIISPWNDLDFQNTIIVEDKTNDSNKSVCSTPSAPCLIGTFAYTPGSTSKPTPTPISGTPGVCAINVTYGKLNGVSNNDPRLVTLIYSFTAKAGGGFSDVYMTGAQWDFTGDGTWDTDLKQSNGTIEHSFDKDGTYNVRLQLQDNRGIMTDVCTKSVTVPSGIVISPTPLTLKPALIIVDQLPFPGHFSLVNLSWNNISDAIKYNLYLTHSKDESLEAALAGVGANTGTLDLRAIGEIANTNIIDNSNGVYYILAVDRSKDNYLKVRAVNSNPSYTESNQIYIPALLLK